MGRDTTRHRPKADQWLFHGGSILRCSGIGLRQRQNARPRRNTAVRRYYSAVQSAPDNTCIACLSAIDEVSLKENVISARKSFRNRYELVDPHATPEANGPGIEPTLARHGGRAIAVFCLAAYFAPSSLPPNLAHSPLATYFHSVGRLSLPA